MPRIANDHTPALPLTFSLRAADVDDVPCLSALGTQVFLDTYAVAGLRPALAREVGELFAHDAVRNWLDAPRGRVIAAESAGMLVGFVQTTAEAAEPLVAIDGATEVNRLYVQRPFLGCGVGRTLLAAAEEGAAASGAPAVWLTAWRGNARALGFYRRQGYASAGLGEYVYEADVYETEVFVKRLGKG